MPRSPDPLTAPETDLRDFLFLPLDVERLRDSELVAVPDAEVFRVAVLSWCVSWHQLPSASLPDDDPTLARLLGFGRDIEGWKQVRAAGGLRGWVKCSDGRLYHPVVAEKAVEAWARKLARRAQTDAARAAREALRQAKLSHCGDRVTTSVTASVTDNATGSKGQGQGQGQGQERREDPPRPPGGDGPEKAPPRRKPAAPWPEVYARPKYAPIRERPDYAEVRAEIGEWIEHTNESGSKARPPTGKVAAQMLNDALEIGPGYAADIRAAISGNWQGVRAGAASKRGTNGRAAQPTKPPPTADQLERTRRAWEDATCEPERNKFREWLAERGVTPEQLFAAVGKPVPPPIPYPSRPARANA